MTCLRKHFVQLWERQFKSSVRLPAAFCFTPDGQNGWRCYFGRVDKVRRSRVSINGSAVYGFVSARELGQKREIVPASKSGMSHNRYIRCRIVDRITKPALAPGVVAAVTELSTASPGMAVAGASGSDPVSLL